MFSFSNPDPLPARSGFPDAVGVNATGQLRLVTNRSAAVKREVTADFLGVMLPGASRQLMTIHADRP